MEFLSIPEELIDERILPYLGWNDLLRLRRVCKATRAIVQGFINVHPDLAPEIEINEDGKSFRAFMNMSIPTARIFLNNAFSGNEFYEKAGEEVVEFLERFGSDVKYVRVDQVSPYLYGKEADFLGGLRNLESFQAGFFGYGQKYNQRDPEAVLNEKTSAMSMNFDDPYYEYYQTPTVYNQLNVKTLKIGNKMGLRFQDVLQLCNNFCFTYNENLEILALPFSSNLPPGALDIRHVPAHIQDNYPVAVMFTIITQFLKMRNSAFKVFDFASYHEYEKLSTQVKCERMGSLYFLEVCEVCVEKDVKLMNVSPYFYLARHQIPRFNVPELGTPVLSLVNLHPCVFPLHMPNLERVEIRTETQSSPGENWRENRPDWPSLKSLDINVKTKLCACMEWISEMQFEARHMVSNENLFQFFFQDVTRLRLTELRLNFEGAESGTVSVPRVEEIVSSCPNLKKLTIINWPGTNKALAKLWSGLPGLEEISLEYCKDLGNVAFIGTDARSPVFLKFTGLKKLTLKGLDQMPKITDKLFTSVLRHLKLTHLNLTSDKQIKSVTLAGIQSLLNGGFAKSIQKFSFQTWSLANMKKDQFKELGKEFRSFRML